MVVLANPVEHLVDHPGLGPKKIALAGLLIGIFIFVSLGIVAWKFVPTANVSSASSSPPIIVGWSGVTLNEVAKFASGNPPSQVFPGQVASDMEYVVQTLAAKGQSNPGAPGP